MGVVRSYSHLLCRRTLPLCSIGLLLVAGSAHAAQANHQNRIAAQSRSGGTVQVRLTGIPDCLDATIGAANQDNEIAEANVDSLLSEDQHGISRPDLALRWIIGNGGKTFTFFLRHGVRFSNGDPFDAASVKWNFDRVLNPASKSQNAAALGPVKTIRVVNKYTVQIVMKTAYRPLLTNLASGYLGMLDPKAPSDQAGKSCQNPIGTGAFKIASVGPGYNTVTLVRNDYHTWGTSWAYNHGKAYLSKIVFKPIVSDSTAISELLTGAVDISPVVGSELPRVQNNAKVMLHRRLDEGVNFLEYNTAKPPFNNPAVRRAIAEAIDRNAIIKAALNGLGRPALGPLPPTIPYYDKQVASLAPKYNPADAQKILAENHVTGPFTLLVFSTPTVQAVAELIQAELGQVGVKVTIVPKQIGDYLSIAGKGQFDLNIFDYTYTDADILYVYFHSSQESGAGLNYTFYKSPTLDRFIVAGRETLNPAAAARAYAQAQRYMDQNVVIDPLWTNLGVTATRTRVHGWHENLFSAGYTVVPIWQDMWVTS
jgi:peptide/nickel transport system substrate-binding protein